jgi:Domain of unknown function (DUF4260)
MATTISLGSATGSASRAERGEELPRAGGERLARSRSVRTWLRLEALALLALSLALYAHGGYGWGRFLALLLVPDLSMLGYFVNPRVGAVSYNLAHSTLGPIALGALAYLGILPMALPLIWLAHVGMDRALGYGLKYPTAFGDTHLGQVGRAAQRLAAA